MSQESLDSTLQGDSQNRDVFSQDSRFSQLFSSPHVPRHALEKNSEQLFEEVFGEEILFERPKRTYAGIRRRMPLQKLATNRGESSVYDIFSSESEDDCFEHLDDREKSFQVKNVRKKKFKSRFVPCNKDTVFKAYMDAIANNQLPNFDDVDKHELVIVKQTRPQTQTDSELASTSPSITSEASSDIQDIENQPYRSRRRSLRPVFTSSPSPVSVSSNERNKIKATPNKKVLRKTRQTKAKNASQAKSTTTTTSTSTVISRPLRQRNTRQAEPQLTTQIWPASPSPPSSTSAKGVSTTRDMESPITSKTFKPEMKIMTPVPIFSSTPFRTSNKRMISQLDEDEVEGVPETQENSSLKVQPEKTEEQNTNLRRSKRARNKLF